MELASQRFAVRNLNIMTLKQEDADNVTFHAILVLETLKTVQAVVLVGYWIHPLTDVSLLILGCKLATRLNVLKVSISIKVLLNVLTANLVVRLVSHYHNVQDVPKICTLSISKKIIHRRAPKGAQQVTLLEMRIEHVFDAMVLDVPFAPHLLFAGPVSQDGIKEDKAASKNAPKDNI